MAIVVPSRFSLLQIVEDDFVPAKAKEAKQKKGDTGNTKKVDDKKKINAKNKNKSQNGNNSQKKKNKPVENIVTDNGNNFTKSDNSTFEEDLRKALLLSQTSNSEFDAINSASDNSEPFRVQSSKKNKKNKLNPQVIDERLLFKIVDVIKNDTEDAPPNSPKLKSIDKNKENQFQREQPTNEEIKGSQLQLILNERDKEITGLKIEIDTLKDELGKVKSRNKLLCNIIAHGEMKEKAQIIMDFLKLKEVQTELTNEVTSLAAQLEQERSKTTSKTDTKVKEKKKRTLSQNDA